MKRAWAWVVEYSDGWKTVGGALGMIGVAWWDQAHNGHASSIVAAFLAAVGVDLSGVGVDWPKAAFALATLLGSADRIRKAAMQKRAGVPARLLLTAKGAAMMANGGLIAPDEADAPDPRRFVLRVSENPLDSPAARERVRRQLLDQVERALRGTLQR